MKDNTENILTSKFLQIFDAEKEKIIISIEKINREFKKPPENPLTVDELRDKLKDLFDATLFSEDGSTATFRERWIAVQLKIQEWLYKEKNIYPNQFVELLLPLNNEIDRARSKELAEVNSEERGVEEPILFDPEKRNKI